MVICAKGQFVTVNSYGNDTWHLIDNPSQEKNRKRKHFSQMERPYVPRECRNHQCKKSIFGPKITFQGASLSTDKGGLNFKNIKNLLFGPKLDFYRQCGSSRNENFSQKTAQQKEQKILKTKMQFFKKLQKLQSFDSRGWSPAMRKLGACHRLFQQKCMRRRRLDLQIERIFSFFFFLSFFVKQNPGELCNRCKALNEIIMESKQGLFPRPVYRKPTAEKKVKQRLRP